MHATPHKIIRTMIYLHTPTVKLRYAISPLIQHVKGWLTTLETPWILPFLMPKIAVLIHWGHKK
jgi:hypothetical protein